MKWCKVRRKQLLCDNGDLFKKNGIPHCPQNNVVSVTRDVTESRRLVVVAVRLAMPGHDQAHVSVIPKNSGGNILTTL